VGACNAGPSGFSERIWKRRREDLFGDGDGDVGSSDLAVVLSGWGTASPLADVNDDGLVDSTDLGVILSAWGPCGKSNT
jgi:hypothetical protein